MTRTLELLLELLSLEVLEVDSEPGNTEGHQVILRIQDPQSTVCQLIPNPYGPSKTQTNTHTPHRHILTYTCTNT